MISYIKYCLFYLFLTSLTPLLMARQPQLDRVAEALNKGDVASAKKFIDKAVSQKTFQNSTRAWFEYGRVYKAMAKGTGTQTLTLDHSAAMDECLQGFKKAVAINDRSDPYFGLAKQSLSAIWGEWVNEGATAFQAERMEEAIVLFDKAKSIKPEDTTAYLYAGIAAQSLEKSSLVLDNFSKLTELGIRDREVYKSLIHYTQKLGRDTLAAIMTAREKFPDDGEFLRLEINHHVYTGSDDVAIQLLENAVDSDPGNAQLLFNLGYLNESLNRLPDAIAAYQKAIQADESYYEPNYNVSVIHYNQAISTLNRIAELSDVEYEVKAPEFRAEGEAGLRSALPFVVRCTELRPKSRSNWETLIVIYDRLGMKSEFEDAKLKLQNLN